VSAPRCWGRDAGILPVATRRLSAEAAGNVIDLH
jgi:hypothetical protein